MARSRITLDDGAAEASPSTPAKEVSTVVNSPQLSRPRSQMVPALRAARNSRPGHFVFVSLQGAETSRFVPHPALKAWLRTYGVSWTFVKPLFFMQDLTRTHRAKIRETAEVVVPAGVGPPRSWIPRTSPRWPRRPCSILDGIPGESGPRPAPKR